MNEKPTPCKCSEDNVVGVQYSITNPYHYDGVSEWICLKCKGRWGRWTGKRLLAGEYEKKYGGSDEDQS